MTAMNELSHETSPYLLQHAANPVHWKAWNDAAISLATQTDRLIIVSTGYSACHWCHVMEHESFEDNEVAEVMNKSFVSIKVDREERPDIDAIYMKAVQLMTGRGGWPMNVVCLPDGRPIWGGTYFRKEEWMSSLEYLAKLYQDDRQKVLDYAEKLHEGISTMNLIPPESTKPLSEDILQPLIAKWQKSFDHEFGGYERAPKFMMPANYRFLLRYANRISNNELADYVQLTLRRMAWGGLFDTVGGGFSRYSVDMKWHVPHFEKMLYDNAQLVSLYSEAFRLQPNDEYREVIEKTLQFVKRELTNKAGGFYCALDADSTNSKGELEEGAFYVWTKQELQRLLGTDYDLFADLYNINDFGHWEHENYVLIRNSSLSDFAQKHKLTLETVVGKKHEWENLLFSVRENRPKPRLDDKCLTSWNALMIKGYVDAYKALGNAEYFETAQRAMEFLLRNCWSADGNLFHSFKESKSSITGYLEDFALTIQALIALYEVTFDENYLRDARQMTDYCFANFYHESTGYFAFKSRLDAALIAPHFEMEDNVIPASNSVMADNLFRLAVYFGNTHYDRICREMVERMLPVIDYPSAFSNWLNVFLNFSSENRELAICAPNALGYAAQIHKKYAPDLMIAGCEAPSDLPFLEGRFAENRPLFYVCRNSACGLPHADFTAALKEIDL